MVTAVEIAIGVAAVFLGSFGVAAVAVAWTARGRRWTNRRARRAAAEPVGSVGPDGFVYWPPCHACGSIAVSCVGRLPQNAVPAKWYSMRCDTCGAGRTYAHAEIVRIPKNARLVSR